MKRSATRSRSLVVTPGRALPRSSDRQRASTCPAAAIRSISSADLVTITPRRSSELVLEPQRGQRRPDVVVDLRRRAASVEAPQEVALLVVVDQRAGLLVVDGKPMLDSLRLVVVALDQLRAVAIALVRLLRGIEFHVVEVAVRRA